MKILIFPVSALDIECTIDPVCDDRVAEAKRMNDEYKAGANRLLVQLGTVR